MARFLALLKGVNVGARTKVPMADLRALCEELGWSGVETYIQSGNVLFDASGNAAAIEAKLEKGLGARFGFTPAVMVRTPAQWSALADANPFTQAAEHEPNRLLIGISKHPPKAEVAEALQARAANGERIALAGGALWFHYLSGVGTSKLSPALIDRLAGSPVTARNWRTMIRLREMLA